jgi:N,N'-diacetylchitobiose transport system substrate-binding protein
MVRPDDQGGVVRKTISADPPGRSGRAGRVLVAAAVAATLAAAGCSSGASGSGGNSAAGSTLTVWLMDGSAPDSLVSALDTEFESSHAGTRVSYQVQQWSGIQDRLTTALASNDPPDVIELGNTQAPKFTQSGALADLTDKKAGMSGATWLDALAATGVSDGKVYATPFYAANRVVVYRTDLFTQAGITTPPGTLDELIADGQKLAAAGPGKPNFSPLYLPGQEWYSLLSMIWAHGGDVATRNGDSWTGALETPAAKAGIADYQKLYKALSKAPADTDEAKPQQSDVMAKGDAAMAIMLPWEAAGVVKANKDLDGKLGAFPIPSGAKTGAAPVFLGGSNLAVAAGSKHADLAQAWLQLMLSDKYQKQLAATGVVAGAAAPGSAGATDPISKAMNQAVSSGGGKVTPVDPRWATIESGANPLKDMLTAVLSGTKTVDAAAADADKAITATLSGAK